MKHIKKNIVFLGVLGIMSMIIAAPVHALSISSVLERLDRYRSVQTALTASAIDALPTSTTTTNTTTEVVPPKKELLPPGVNKRVLAELRAASGGSPKIITRVVKYGATRSDDVRKLQVFLVAKGYLEAKPNGVFGKQTRDALRKFQADQGIQGDGTLVGPATRAAIEKVIVTEAEQLTEIE